MNIAESYLEELKEGRVIVHAKERAYVLGGMAYRFGDGSIIHVVFEADAVGIKTARAYRDADALLCDPSLHEIAHELPDDGGPITHAVQWHKMAKKLGVSESEMLRSMLSDTSTRQ